MDPVDQLICRQPVISADCRPCLWYSALATHVDSLECARAGMPDDPSIQANQHTLLCTLDEYCDATDTDAIWAPMNASLQPARILAGSYVPKIDCLDLLFVPSSLHQRRSTNHDKRPQKSSGSGAATRSRRGFRVLLPAAIDS